MSWLITTVNKEYSQVITEKVLVLEGQVYYEEPNEMRSLPVSELQGNIYDCREAHPSSKFLCCNVHRAFLSVVCYSKVIPIDSYIGRFMRFWYFCTPKKDVDEGSG